MSKRYYRKYNKKSNNFDIDEDSPIGMLVEMLISILIWLVQLFFKLIYKIFILVRDLFFKTKIDKKVSPDIQSEIQPIPEILFKEEKKEKEVYLPYKKKSFLLTRAEYNFDKVLTEVVQDKYYIGRQVLLSNIIEVTSTYRSYRSKIDKKSIDFVLFNKNGYTPYLAIELDDSSHSRWDRVQRDEFVQDVLNKAGIRLLRIKNAYVYNKEDISKMI